MRLKTPAILFIPLDGDISGGNLVCREIAGAVGDRGWKVVAAIPSEGPLFDLFRESGARVEIIDTRRTFSIDAAFAIARLIRAEGIDLVHTHAMLSGMVLGSIGAMLGRVPVIAHIHGQMVYNRFAPIAFVQKLAGRLSARLAGTQMIAVSESVKRELIANGTSASQIRVIYNGVATPARPLSRNVARRSLAIPPDTFVVLHMGRLDANKGQDTLIRAMVAVTRERPEAQAWLLGSDGGSGAYRELIALADRLGLAGNVFLPGQQTDVQPYLAAADVLALPSLAEGLPLVILEAMAMAKPVIASRVGGIGEAVVDGETGILIEPGDIDNLAQGILRIAADPDWGLAMGVRGRERVAELFSVGAMVHPVLEMYQSLIRQQRGQ